MNIRHTEALNYALESIKNNEISQYIKDILLYGSCARNQEKWGSDIDLFIVFTPDFGKLQGITRIINRVKNECSPNELESVDIDIHYTIGDEWKESKRAYYSNIRKEGISVWN